MKRAFIPAILVLTAFAPNVALADCYGSERYKTCTDQNGNSYTVQKYGNSTQVQGYNYETGNSWSQSTNRVGNSSYTTGYDAEGNSWSQNTRRIGNTTYQDGYDSDGNSYNGTIRSNGSSRTYQGIDSDGNYYHKTCTAYGCY